MYLAAPASVIAKEIAVNFTAIHFRDADNAQKRLPQAVAPSLHGPNIPPARTIMPPGVRVIKAKHIPFCIFALQDHSPVELDPYGAAPVQKIHPAGPYPSLSLAGQKVCRFGKKRHSIFYYSERKAEQLMFTQPAGFPEHAYQTLKIKFLIFVGETNSGGKNSQIVGAYHRCVPFTVQRKYNIISVLPFIIGIESRPGMFQGLPDSAVFRRFSADAFYIKKFFIKSFLLGQ
jgi:hypothetical protein